MDLYVSNEVFVGNIGVGGNNPVRIQSMTNTPTHDVKSTVAQIVRLVKKGCEIVRVTVQGKREARACKLIREELNRLGIHVPLVADIHFYPPAALMVADYVDKVRINPGNFLDKRAQFKKEIYTDLEYKKELQELKKGFSPLVVKCKRLNRAIRVGVNHGSLCDRIMTRFGNSPLGMCISALEYLRVCKDLAFDSVIVSMKSSNVRVMIEAYRLLVTMMQKEGMAYPLHLGVTEAGLGMEGRIKSFAGIGALLQDAIGDTIRVSLTEDPEEEIEPAKQVAALKKQERVIFNPYPKREIKHPLLDHRKTIFFRTKGEKDLRDLGYKKQLNRWMAPKKTFDFIFDESFVQTGGPEFVTTKNVEDIPSNGAIIIYQVKRDFVQNVRQLRKNLIAKKDARPLLVELIMPKIDLALIASSIVSLLVDEVMDGFSLQVPGSAARNLQLCQALLQAARVRMSSVEMIACPGCGRTLFDLQKVAERIKKKSAHLIGTKIAVMGCIVNGPGEMADADYGYVGSSRGKVDLYKGRDCVVKGLEQEGADDRLIAFIESDRKYLVPKVHLY